MTIDRNTFLAAAKTFKREPITIEGIGEVFVREPSAADSAQYAKKVNTQGADSTKAAAWLVVRVLVDEKGDQLLTDGDIDAVALMPLRVLKNIVDKSEKLSGVAEKKGDTSS
jgi:hypothetical protein